MGQRKKTEVIDPVVVQEFERLHGQLKTFNEDFRILSRKHSNEALNKFKLSLLNDPLKKATQLLGEEYRPIVGFEAFSDVEMPTTSDVCIVLSQYLTSMDRFKADHTERNRNREWLLDDEEEEEYQEEEDEDEEDYSP